MIGQCVGLRFSTVDHMQGWGLTVLLQGILIQDLRQALFLAAGYVFRQERHHCIGVQIVVQIPA